MRIAILLLSIFCSCAVFSQSLNDNGLPVFDHAAGFGMDTKGGAGGKIIKVTNLLASGKGSLTDAIQQPGPRIVVFEVAGIIDLNRKSLKIEDPYITIAGQTAPDPGITIIKGGISITTHQVIIQHIRVRPGEANQPKKSGWEVDGINTSQGAYQVIIDHCSVSWSTDENISASGPRFEGAKPDDWRKNTSHKILISNCIIAEGLSNSTHAKGEHSKGSLIHDNATEIAVVGNLFSCNVRRNPYFKGGVQGIVVNNYVYNPGRSVVHYGLIESEWEGHDWITGKMVVEGNVFEYGPDTNKKIDAGSFRGPVELFWQDNLLLPQQKQTRPKGMHTLVRNRPVWPTGFTAIKASQVKQHVLEQAGARPWNRDAIDRRIIQGIINQTARIIDSEQEVGGYPEIKPVYQHFDASGWDLHKMVKKYKP